MTAAGIAYLVGAGPGDPGLFTLRGMELLGRAEVVIYDGLVNPALLRLAPPAAELIYAGKHDRTRCTSQSEINALLLAKVKEGKRVVRLKGGDPYLFGRGGEEAEWLADSGVAFEVVPGVSSMLAVPSCAGIALTHREHTSSLTIITGHEDPSSPSNKLDWSRLAGLKGTLVVLMGLKNLPQIAAVLIALGHMSETPVAVVSQGATARQKTVTGTLSTIAEEVRKAGLVAPAMIIIGDVVKLRDKLNWFERRPLFGRRIVVTQRQDLARPTVARLCELGAEVLEIPATHWAPHPDQVEQDRIWARLRSYDWLLFSNPLSVDFFFERFLQVHGDLRELGPVKLGAYGPRTGEQLRRWHLKPAAISDDHKTPLIMEALTRGGLVSGHKFLLLRGEGATEKVPEALRRLGANVDVVPGYSVQPEQNNSHESARQLAQGGADWIIFASAMAIEHFHHQFDLLKLVRERPNLRLAIASPDIQYALEKLGLSPAAISPPNDVDALLRAIVASDKKT